MSEEELVDLTPDMIQVLLYYVARHAKVRLPLDFAESDPPNGIKLYELDGEYVLEEDK